MNYKIDNNRAIITSWPDPPTFVELPESIDGFPVYAIEAYAFSGTAIEEIHFPATLTHIGRYAFYNCRKLHKISFHNNITDLGPGAFTGCHKVSELEVYFGNSASNHKSNLREFLVDLAEEQTVTLHMKEGDAKLIFPQYFEEAVENTPARILELHTHGSGMIYRNCFVNRELDFHLYDSKFENAKAKELGGTIFLLALYRLLYPYKLEAAARDRYLAYLRDNLEDCGITACKRKDSEALLYLAKNCTEAPEDMEHLITLANRYHMAEAMSALMQEKHRRFGARRRKFEL